MMDLIGNHLWQSTLFASAAALLTLLFRKNAARVRYGLWLAASLKFLIPFTLFIAIGNSLDLHWQQPVRITPPAVLLVKNFSQPFGVASSGNTLPAPLPSAKGKSFSYFPAVLLASWLGGSVVVLASYIRKGQRVRSVVRESDLLNHGRAFEALHRLQQHNGIRVRIRMASSQSTMEPGVFGVFRPVLLLPSGMLERLSDTELEAIIAHECSHVRSCDNFVAVVHMLVEALFWFHPMVWWLGSKLVEERECACDEAVLQLGKDPQAYAEGILKVCEFYLESPLACVSGVTGSDMKKRIHAIMTHRIGRRLSWVKKLLLMSAGIFALAVPITVGLLKATPIRTRFQGSAEMAVPAGGISPAVVLPSAIPAAGYVPVTDSPAPSNLPPSRVQSPVQAKVSFETVSIQPSLNCINPGVFSVKPGRFENTCVTVTTLIFSAYGMQPYQLSSGPEWISSRRFDIEAKSSSPDHPARQGQMLQSLLEERFHLKMHRETRDVPAYALTLAEGGPKFQPAKDDSGNPIVDVPKTDGSITLKGEVRHPGPGECFTFTPPGFLECKAVPIEQMAGALATVFGRPVMNKTGLSGLYNFSVNWEPSAAHPTLTAIQDQLGLVLRPEKGTAEVYVIDSVEKPSLD
jgi:bla regulator protein blaR1